MNEKRGIKTVTILLTKYSDFVSNIIYHISGHGYTHVSFALCEDEATYYSFNYQGFCLETLEKHRHCRNSISYKIKISDESYDKIKSCIEQFKLHKSEFRYTRIGVVLCVLGIPFKWKKHYFCSQFVAEILYDSKAIPLKKNPSLYLPNHFFYELDRSSQILKINYNLI